ncbi:alpha-L-fucosidase isoform X1 [Prorops nasuta]|uniref:alpha-L-fucosidase isoform X1 n=1 Tax=Prorops nasuta TaxID=863751 RepID=UPI0034CE4F38
MLLLLLLYSLCSASYSLESNYRVLDINEEKQYLNDYFKAEEKYKPTWESLDSRPLPSWYDNAKLGIFLHWGVYSVPSFGSEWFWANWKGARNPKYVEFMKKNYPLKMTYQEFAKDFTAEFFNASQWSELFKASGANYIVLTSKHHEGYTLWDSSYSFSWNAKDIGPGRDLVGELSTALRKNTDIKFGLYHSLYEWFNPLYLSDKRHNFTTNEFVTKKVLPEMKEIIERYKPDVLWSDGDWEADDSYWDSKNFLTWLYNSSPVKNSVVVNDRWGRGIPCHHGDFYTCTDRFNPGILQPHKWENAMTIDKKSWGYRRNAALSEYYTLKQLVKELVVTVSCGGNLLMNVGPTKDGIISPIFEERLRGMGEWLSVNGEAIYNTKPWKAQNDTLTSSVWYTQNVDKKAIYLLLLDWPENNQLYLGSLNLTSNTQLSLLGTKRVLNWEKPDQRVLIKLPVEENKGQPAWVIKIQQE